MLFESFSFIFETLGYLESSAAKLKRQQHTQQHTQTNVGQAILDILSHKAVSAFKGVWRTVFL